jgi:hypothetical protein
MEEFVNKLVEQLMGRIEGPMNLRMMMQPAVAIFLAFRDGSADAKNSCPPYFWSLFTQPGRRREQLKNGWKSISKVFLAAILLDLAFQFITTHQMIPRQAFMVALILAIIPYLLIRGLVTRIRRPVGRS